MLGSWPSTIADGSKVPLAQLVARGWNSLAWFLGTSITFGNKWSFSAIAVRLP